MKKVICKVEYDTDNADGYEETLYKTAQDKFFLYVNGGSESKYPEENIKRMSADKANEWLGK